MARYRSLRRPRRDERFEEGDQSRQVFLHCLPHDIKVYVEIRMNEPIAHADDFILGNGRQLIACGFRYTGRCFSQDRDIHNQR